MANIGDAYLIRNDMEFYRFFDTDPRFLDCGIVVKLHDENGRVFDIWLLKSQKVMKIDERKNGNSVMSFEEYTKGIKDIAHHLTSNLHWLEDIKRELERKSVNYYAN